MNPNFDDELRRGKAKISQTEEQIQFQRQKQKDQIEEQKHEAFIYFNLHDFVGLRTWSFHINEPEKVIFQSFISEIRSTLPKVIPYTTELKIVSKDKFSTDTGSDYSMTLHPIPWGEYAYTEFRVSATVEIPSFAHIWITWEDNFDRNKPSSFKNVKITLSYNGDRDLDVALVKAKERFENGNAGATNSRQSNKI